MRVLVCGSRSWGDVPMIRSRLMDLPEGTVIVHGAARMGADRIADVQARALGFAVEAYPAKWYKYKPRDPAKKNPAGIVRNLEMLDSGIDLVVAFHDGTSPGTAHTVGAARERGIPVEVHHAGVTA